MVPRTAGSYERLFHEVGIPRFFLPLRTDLELASALAGPRLERSAMWEAGEVAETFPSGL